MAPSTAPSALAFLARKHDDAQKAIEHFHSLLHTREGHDVTLWFLGEATRLVAVLLDTLSQSDTFRHPKESLLFGPWLKLAAKLRLPWGLTPRASTRLPLSAISGRAAERMGVLADILEDWQILNRFWGLLDMWVAIKTLLADTLRSLREKKPVNWPDTLGRALEHLCLVGYHFGEATAWLTGRRFLGWSTKMQEKMALLSVRSWAGYLVLVMIRRLAQLMPQRIDGSSEKRAPEWDAQSKKEWNREFFNNLAWFPVAISLSVPGGLLPPTLTSILAFNASVRPVRDIWEDTEEEGKEEGGET
ncbi:unnamed protein product [Clonostachys byssicola]|uniref:Uncharacterized protein n=1 Tax=Clonostachys byssicola TaxID=160290 RepID=A0A9N9Y816_9HYPO|nr:unnamed protein product [Clonostachys byssicola]